MTETDAIIEVAERMDYAAVYRAFSCVMAMRPDENETRPFNPLTNANDDVAILEYFRKIKNSQYYKYCRELKYQFSLSDTSVSPDAYNTGDYFRAACKAWGIVIDE